MQRTSIGSRANILEEGRPTSLCHLVGQNENIVSTLASNQSFNALNSVSQNIVFQFAARTWGSVGPERVRWKLLNSWPVAKSYSLKVLMAGVKPSAPAWAGIGDFDVVRTEKVYSSWRSYTLQQSVSEETELFDENKKLVLTLGCRCGTGRRTGGSWSAPTWGWLHLNTKAGLLVGEGTALPPSTYIWQLSIPVCAPFTVFSPRWDGEGFTTNSSSWVGMRDREGQKLPNGEHPAIHWNR